MIKRAVNFAALDKFILLSFLLVVAFGTVIVSFPDGAVAILVVLVLTVICIYVFRQFTDEKDFITRLFLAALTVRLGFGIFVHVLELRDFFGGDALTYDYRGSVLLDIWMGRENSTSFEGFVASSTSNAGWGMNYLVAILYFLLGKNIFAAQSFCAVVGAATAPMVYYCADRIFENRRVAKYAAIAVAFFPAMIIWSGQLLKDGLIIFLLVLAMTMVLQLQKKFNVVAVMLLVFSLFGILSLRFYIFYMVVIAVVSSFVVGVSKTNRSMVARLTVLAVLGIGLTYFGIARMASTDLDKYGNLQRVQNSRMDLARSAQSGFGADTDVSTAEGAITAIPEGLTVLMLAPFPWQVTSVRSAIVLPETILWWAMIPMMIAGIWWTIKHRLRNALPVLIFAMMLTFAYSIFQGNVGTAYRQRTQIQVFLFIFGSVGWVIRSERRKDHAEMLAAQRARIDARIRANAMGADG